MDTDRAAKVAEIYKTTQQLGKNIKKPGVAKRSTILEEARVSGVPQPVEGTGLMRILMYIAAGLLVLGLILLAVDQWITPIFVRKPGSSGYIPVPGTDTSIVYWTSSSSVISLLSRTPVVTPTNITIGNVVATAAVPNPVSCGILVGQSIFSLTMDVYIVNDATTSTLPINDPTKNTATPPLLRTLFFIGSPGASSDGTSNTATTQKLLITMEPNKNSLNITAASSQENVIIDNVPMNTAFRIGLVSTPYTLEGYLNGRLVMTRHIQSTSPITLVRGDIIYAPANIQGTGNMLLSAGIKVMNLRVFAYEVGPSEMLARMYDLAPNSVINPSLR